MITLSHFSALDTLTPHAEAQDDRARHKPRGLWVSVDGEDDWPAWCREEDFSLGNLAYQFRIRLTGDARVLLLDSVSAIRAFHQTYSAEYGYIDWKAVAHRHQGVIIAPYQWSLRLDSEVAWYYGWDVASGCIWDPSAIASVQLMAEVPV